MTTIIDIENAVNDARFRFSKRIKEMVEAQGFNNGGREPTQGKDYRLHAPCDGYIWYGRTYLGGQYLALDEDSEYQTRELKIKVRANLKDMLVDIFGNGSIGKTWEKDGKTYCYFYASCSKPEYDAVSKILTIAGKRVVLVSEHGTGGQKTWKFSSAKVLVKSNNFDLDFELFAPGVKLKYEKGRTVKKQLREWYSDFDGQEVRYLYSDGAIES